MKNFALFFVKSPDSATLCPSSVPGLYPKEDLIYSV